MRKQLGILTSLLFLSVLTLLWTGCSNRNSQCSEPCEPICPMPSNPVEPSQPIYPSYAQLDDHQAFEYSMNSPNEQAELFQPSADSNFAQSVLSTGSYGMQPNLPSDMQSCGTPYAPQLCYPGCVTPLQPCQCGPSGKCACNGVMVQARNPKMCMLGERYPLDLEITACCDVCEVILTATIPEGATFIRSQPEARFQGRQIILTFGQLSKGQTVSARIWLKCEREGDLCACFCVKATPVAFCSIRCAKPVLVCEKSAPAEVCPGQPIHYTVTVTNIGSCTARDVLVTDILPDGLEHASGQRTLNFRLGDLEPCQTKKVDFCATACKRGRICNTVVASACNANQTSCEACTCICCCAIECHKIGPREVPVGQNADYQISVVNTGDRTLREIVMTDSAPLATTIVAAPGANICGKQAIWRLRELCPGETVTFTITLTTCSPGLYANYAHVETCEGCQTCCEFGTKWRGRPALDVCVTSCENPICVGETTRFKIVVVNKGQEYDSNVQVVADFPPELVPVNTSGVTTARVNGQTVEFSPFISLAPCQTLEYYITVEANAPGDLRPRIQVSSDFIKNPITQEESLIVN